MISLPKSISQLREQLVLVFMLELLHFSLWTDFSGLLSRSLILMHLGAFLIWQPLWQGDERLRWYDILLLVLITYLFVFWLSWWLMFAWLILLMGLSGGRVLINRRERTIYMLTLVFLAVEILIRATPMLFNISISGNLSDLFEILLPALPVIILMMPNPLPDKRFRSVDFIHAISISTLTSLLVAGTLLGMYRTNSDYVVALIQTLIVIGVFLLAISWLLIPRAGFSGLSQLWQRSMLNIGTPFEAWLNNLSLLSRQNNGPEEFLASAMEELTELPWIEGVEWEIADLTHFTGEEARYTTHLDIDELDVTIYSNTPVSGALYLHCKLLIQLVNNFYMSKRRERELTRQTHMQAVYETGARITHDIKNILQSLQAITSIVMTESDQENFQVSGRILRRQMPALTQRLRMALEKLQAPETGQRDSVFVKDWWHDFTGRTEPHNIRYHADISGDPAIPGELFDSVVENLLENFRTKCQLEHDIQVTVSLYTDSNEVLLTVSDNGSRIPEDIARVILREPLPSNTGLGIGLYQAARLAETCGYRFSLRQNLDGNVCFELRRVSTPNQIHLI